MVVKGSGEDDQGPWEVLEKCFENGDSVEIVRKIGLEQRSWDTSEAEEPSTRGERRMVLLRLSHRKVG